MGDLSDIQRGRIVGARLAGASVIKTVTSLGVSRAEVRKVIIAIQIMGRRHQLRVNSGRKQKFSKNDRHTFVSKFKRLTTIRKTY
jgi:hypothetical protein